MINHSRGSGSTLISGRPSRAALMNWEVAWAIISMLLKVCPYLV